MEDIMVSVYLLTYNHKDYLEQAINSILSQKTSYKLEIIIHDDASTDGTSEIVRQYATLYPTIIIPVIQQVNQYRTGRILIDHVFPKMKGKYIAYLEGDDYWSDEGKIQREVDYLENHSEYIAVAHNTERINVENGERDLLYSCFEERDISITDVLENGNNSFHLNSIVYRKDILNYYPAFMDIPRGFFGDLSLRLLLISNGKIHYFPETMSVYRYLVPGSSSKRIGTQEAIIEEKKVIIRLYRAVDEYQKRKNHELFEKFIKEIEYEIKEREGCFEELYSSHFIEIWKKKSLTYKMKIIIKARCGVLYSIYKGLKKK